MICVSLIPSFTKAEENPCLNYQVSLDLLYWQAHERSACLTNKALPVFYTNDFTNSHVIHSEFDWAPGFRLGVEVSGCCFPMDLDWTYYSTTLRQHRKANSNDLTNVNNQLGMFPIWSLSDDTISGDYVSEAKQKWKIILNQIDFNCFELPFCFQQFEFHPYAGLRAVYIQQNARIKYSGGIFLYEILEGGVSQNGTDRIHMRNDFFGIGPNFGINPRWNLCQEVTFFGTMGISGLVGLFNIDQKETFLGVDRFSQHKHLFRLRWVGDLAAGIAWDTCLCNYPLSLQLGYEYHIFFHQLELQKDDFHLTPSNRDLSFQGVVLSGNIDF